MKKHTQKRIYISGERLRLLKQIETANICLNVERDCISVIHASLFKCFSMSNLFGKKVKSCEYKVITLNYKQVGVFIKKDTQDIEVHHRNLC